MKFAQLTSIAATAVLTMLGLPVSLAAQGNAEQYRHHQYHHYQLVDVGTFGGPQSFQYAPQLPRAGVLNNRGAFAGWADTSTIDPLCFFDAPDCNAAHAFVWQNGAKTDLGVLPGGLNSQVNWISGNGLAAGVGDNGQMDPLAGIPQIRSVLWGHDGNITDLGALPGAYFANTSALNSRGEVVGFALNTIPDPYSLAGLGYQTRAFYWKNGVMQDLGTLGTGTDAIAGLINERGQVVGWSYTNATPSAFCAGVQSGFALTTSSFIWDKKNGMKDLGGLGGTCTIAYDLNNRGQVVGQSNHPDDLAQHPFVWDRATGITELPTGAGAYGDSAAINDDGEIVGEGDAPDGQASATLWRKTGGKWQTIYLGRLRSGDCARSESINASGQVVGVSGPNGCSTTLPFLWEEGGPMVDLNTLVPPNSGILLVEAVQINDRGEIAVNGTDANNNNHSVLLIPCDEHHPDVSGCDYDLIDAETAAAHVSLDPAQHPKALAPGTRMPGMFNRFRFPKSRPVPGHAPVPGASLAISATPATGDWLGDHRLIPQYGTASYCEISNGVLNGLCRSHTAYSCPGSFTGCNTGQPATLGAPLVCGNVEYLLSTTKCGSVPGFDVSTTGLTPTTVSAGGSATSTFTVSGYGGFSGSVAFSCSVQPAPALAPSCLFSPSSVSAGTPSTLTVSTTAPTSALRTGTGPGLFYALFLPFAMVLRFGPPQKTKGKFTAATLACMLFAGVAFQAACGAKPPTPGTPAGSYIITVTGTDSSGTLAIPTTMAPLDVQ
jgi:probable HAF family extracellular repeat protein